MTYLLATATVQDFDAWKSSFNSNDSFRTENGQRGYQVFQTVDDPNEIVVLFDWVEGEAPRAFFESEAMRERMVEAGLTGMPELSEMEIVEQKSGAEPAP